ncbi:tyrosine-type recombinase/integrase [Spongiibacter sp. KMU-158]|uniref:Tyrosine-type recombinase/integrase n=1 Tax=Spongiibacter pelagi TaxID=2760804 RepID=A0A927C5C0_9GAMM|nr:tyrosine-type recombinase/integrase [Spongiibacter pelagi]
MAIRDKAFFLTGFWFAFRSDELVRLTFENIKFSMAEPKPGQAPKRRMELYLQTSKTDRESTGRSWQLEELPHLCPVNAMLDWQSARMVENGPVFVKIGRWGNLGDSAIHHNRVSEMMRVTLKKAGIEEGSFSSHSLRRGFANFAKSLDASTKDLMDWVQWSDERSANRYLDTSKSLPMKLLGERITQDKS